MDNKYGVEHEQEVLAAFNKMTDDFGRGLPMHEEGDRQVTLFDIFGDENEAEAPKPEAEKKGIIASRSERHAAKRKEKQATEAKAASDAKPSAKTEQKERKSATDAVLAKTAAGNGNDGGNNDGAGQKKKVKKGKRKMKKFWKIFWIFVAFCFVCCVVAGIFVGKYVYGIIQDTEEINPSNIYDYLSENSVMVDRDGNFMENIYSGDALRTNTDFDEMPENLVNAFVAIEDKTFWDHHGFNFVRILGAIRDALKYDKRIGGTSTLTQQLARNIYLTDTKSSRGQEGLERKIREAYYTYIIENSLTKEQILEAYLNTVYLGFNSNGVNAAANAYFDKNVQDLSLIECAVLAALPQSPNNYAPMKRISANSITEEDGYQIISKSDEYYIVYNDGGEARTHLVLRNMLEQGYITQTEYDTASGIPIYTIINPGTTILSSSSGTSYFADYVISKVLADIQSEIGLDESDARKLLYNGGLTVNTTLDSTIQKIMEEEYANTDNFPGVGTYSSDKKGNILNENGSKILLYKMENMIDADGNFTLQPEEYEWKGNGDLLVYGGGRLNFYKTVVGETIDYSVEFKNMFEKVDGFFYSRSGGVWTIAAKYKDRDDSGNLILSKDYFIDYPDAFRKNGDGSLSLTSDHFTVADRVRQPQSAMVIENYSTGEVVGMIGGRDIEGKKLYNRATSPRQPGSSMKPLAVYSTALQYGAEGRGNFTAATAIDDAPMSFSGQPWPKNWYTGYRGMTNLRHAVEQSINACAVNLYMQLDPYDCIENLQKMGISTVVTSGTVNDINASALALGGMTKGVAPLEMCAAYGTFGNFGTFVEPICYTTVVNKKGDIILEKTPRQTVVYDEAVASLMTDILRTTVTQGLASKAKLKSQPSAGKTGTTSERYDIWFCGLTPKYSAATWIGNDINISLSSGSDAAVQLWKVVMERVGELDERGEFEMRGDFVNATVDRYSGLALGDLSNSDSRGNSSLSEVFIAGTVPGETDTSHVLVTVCGESGYLATPSCYSHVQKVGIVRPSGMSWEKMCVEYGFKKLDKNSEPDAMYDAPDYYCPIHNPDPILYPISPLYNGENLYNPSDVQGIETGHWEEDPVTGELIWISDQMYDPAIPVYDPLAPEGFPGTEGSGSGEGTDEGGLSGGEGEGTGTDPGSEDNSGDYDIWDNPEDIVDPNW